MKIVILDGYTLNPGDLSWAELKTLGEVEIYDHTPADKIISRSTDAEIIITNKTPLDKQTMAALPKVKYIGVLATGYNVVDISAASEKGIIVTNIPTYGTDSVAQMVFAHILNLTQRVEAHAQTVKHGKWANCRDFCYWDFPLIELAGKTIGIIGLGRIGKSVARIARGFNMIVVAYDKFASPDDTDDIEMVTVDELVKISDIITLHCPLTNENQKMINEELIAKFKPNAFLINTSRGPLIDEHALAKALNNGLLAGAGLDVLVIEPPEKDNPLISAKNCFITPHIAWATFEARKRLLDTAIENVKAYLKGQPINKVTP